MYNDDFDGIINSCLSDELTFVVSLFDDKTAGCYC